MRTSSKNKLTKQQLFEIVSKCELPSDIKEQVEKYWAAGGKRDLYLWKWAYLVFKNSGVTLSCVDPKFFDSVVATKVILTLFTSMHDDIADKSKDEIILKEMLKIPFNINAINFGVLNPEQQEYVKTTIEVWQFIEKKVKSFPNYEFFKDIFEYDVKQLLNSILYSYLVNKKHEILNLNEAQIYSCHNMVVFSYIDIDLMASPTFGKKELPLIRRVCWYAQQMARIGNWLSTWKREIPENDVTAGVIPYCLEKKIITLEELNHIEKEKIIKKIEKSNAKKYFIKDWKKNYTLIKKLSPQIKTVKIQSLLDGLEKLLALHLQSEGYK